MNPLYLDLMEKCLTNTIYCDAPDDNTGGTVFHWTMRTNGRDWPSVAHSMIGTKRMHQLREACETCIKEAVAGDFIETGIWRGGACIMMAAVLKVYGSIRTVWCADSFQGLPASTAKADSTSKLHTFPQLSVSLKQVKRNFKKYDLLDENVKFLEGWFKDTLPQAPIENIALLRLDGDLYESTMQALDALYAKVSSGGFVIVDDYYSFRGCRQAIEEFRLRENIICEMIKIDKDAVYWRK